MLLPLVCGFIIYFSIRTDVPAAASEGLCGLFALLSVLVIFIESGLARNII
ncbi:hypothetical protein ACPA9J_23720 [Pseudomonas aeruginosa]